MRVLSRRPAQKVQAHTFFRQVCFVTYVSEAQLAESVQ